MVADHGERTLIQDESPEGDLPGLLELADYLQMMPRDLERLTQRGLIPGEESDGRWRFRPREVDAWLDLGLAGWGTSDLLSLVRTGPKRPSLEGALSADHVLLDVVAADWMECFRRAVGALRLSQEVERGRLLQALLARVTALARVPAFGTALRVARNSTQALEVVREAERHWFQELA